LSIFCFTKRLKNQNYLTNSTGQKQATTSISNPWLGDRAAAGMQAAFPLLAAKFDSANM
jgi:hypothetical protein